MFLRVLLLYLVGFFEGTFANHGSEILCTSLNCTFDAGYCCWTPESVYMTQWQRHVYLDATSSRLSGHSKDHTTPKRGYISTLLNADDAQVALISPYVNGGTYCLSVWYGISGSDVTLEVYTQLKTGGNFQQEFQTTFSYGNMWQNALIQIHSGGSFRVDLRAKAGTILHDGEISIDDVSVTKTTCPLGCSFKSGLCAWHILYIEGNGVFWSRATSYTGKDFYLRTQAYDQSAGKALLRSSWQTPGHACLSIHVDIFGTGANTLNVYIERSPTDREHILAVSDRTVKEVNVTLNMNDNYRVILVGDVQHGEGEDIYIYNITRISGPCTKECNSNPCFNGATCVESVTDNTYRCRCANGWTGEHCTDIVSTTESLPTAETEPPTTKASTNSKDVQEEIPKDTKSLMLYIVIASAVAVFLLIVGGVVFLLVLLRNRRRKQRFGDIDNRQRNADNINWVDEANAYELNEPRNEETGAENHNDGLLQRGHNVEDENAYTEAHACDASVTKTETNFYNHLNETVSKTIIDQTYSHIPNAKLKGNIVDQTYSHISNTNPNESVLDQTYSHIPNTKPKETNVDQTYSQIPNTKPKGTNVDQTYSHIPYTNPKESNVDQTYSHIQNTKPKGTNGDQTYSHISDASKK